MVKNLLIDKLDSISKYLKLEIITVEQSLELIRLTHLAVNNYLQRPEGLKNIAQLQDKLNSF